MIFRLLIISSLLLAWAVLVEPRWVAHRNHQANLPDGKQRGLTVVQTSDWHFTKKPLWRVMTHARAQQIIQDINQTKPDIILITGDLIAEEDQAPSFAKTREDEIAITLGKLTAKMGVYAVLGNHDNWYDHAKMKQALNKQGIHVLENDALYLKQAKLWIAGIGDASTGYANVNRTLRKIPQGAASLVMMHDPASFRDIKPKHNSISFAGHTHGGQVSIPFYGALIMPTQAPATWAYGWVNHHQNNMYVTSGLGVSVLPVRFNMRPEWVTFNI